MDDGTYDDRLARTIACRDESPSAMDAARAACAELYQRHARRLIVFLSSRILASDLEDIHQAVWQRVWNQLPKSYRGGNLQAWIFQIAKNYLIDCSRRKKAESHEALDSLVDETAIAPDRLAEEKERMAGLEHCLKQLEKTMAIVVRGRLTGEAYQTICQRAGLEAAQAHKMFHMGKQQLQDCIRNRNV